MAKPDPHCDFAEQRETASKCYASRRKLSGDLVAGEVTGRETDDVPWSGGHHPRGRLAVRDRASLHYGREALHDAEAARLLLLPSSTKQERGRRLVPLHAAQRTIVHEEL